MTKTKNVSAVRSAFVVSSIIVAVKLLGFVKQAVIAYYLGASAQTDAYFLAYSVIGGVSQAVFSAVSVSMIPMYLQRREKDGKTGTDSFTNSVLVVFGAFALLLTLIFAGFSPIFSKVVGMKLENEQSQYLAFCFRQESLICFCYGLITIFGAVLEAEKRFIPLRLNGIFLSTTIMSALIVSQNKSTTVLLYATIVSNVIEVCYMYLCARRFFKLGIRRISLKSTIPLIQLTLPLLFGNAIIQINSIIDKVLATSVSEGGASCLSYGQVLYEFVNATLIVSLSAIAFSFFAGAVAKKEQSKLLNYLKKAVSYLVIALLPISVYSLIEARDIVTLIYARGEFSSQSVEFCTQALRGYAIGFVFIATREVLVKAHYAFQDTKRPMTNGIIAVMANVILSITLSRPFGLLGITVATSIAAVISMLLSNRTLKVHIEDEKVCKASFIIKMILSAICIVSLGYLTRHLCGNNCAIISRMMIVLVVVFSVYAIMLVLLRVKEFSELLTRCSKFISHKSLRVGNDGRQ